MYIYIYIHWPRSAYIGVTFKAKKNVWARWPLLGKIVSFNGMIIVLLCYYRDPPNLALPV